MASPWDLSFLATKSYVPRANVQRERARRKLSIFFMTEPEKSYHILFAEAVTKAHVVEREYRESLPLDEIVTRFWESMQDQEYC